nr:MAG TPA: large terminase [Caudoviricetes sp.]
MPWTEKQLEYNLHCNRRWNIKTGATGSGKSFLDYTLIIPKRICALKGEGLAVFLGNTRGTLERNILSPMRDRYGTELVGNIRSDNTVKLFGHTIYALGADNKKRVEKIQGSTIEYAYGDEITTWDQEVFEMLKSRLRTEHSHFDGTCNPANPQHWFKKFLDSDADIYQQSYCIDDGCLPPKVVEELKKEYAGTFRYKRYILGLWAMSEGIIYGDCFNDSNILDTEPGTAGDYYVSSDYGIQNATVFLLWRFSPSLNAWVCLDEYYYSGRDERRQKTVAELVDGYEELTQGREIKQTIVDPSAAALIVELRKRGHRTRQADNDVLPGIADVQTMLKGNRLLFMRRCKHTIDEFGVYSWDEQAADRGEDKPIKENDHSMDAVRYFVRTMKLVKKEKKPESRQLIYL